MRDKNSLRDAAMDAFLRGDHESVVALLEEVVRTPAADDWNVAEDFARLGGTYSRLGRWRMAEDAYRRAIRRAEADGLPMVGLMRLGLASNLLEQDRLTEVVDLLKSYIDGASRREETPAIEKQNMYLLLARAHRRAGSVELAREAGVAALELGGDKSGLIELLAEDGIFLTS